MMSWDWGRIEERVDALCTPRSVFDQLRGSTAKREHADQLLSVLRWLEPFAAERGLATPWLSPDCDGIEARWGSLNEVTVTVTSEGISVYSWIEGSPDIADDAVVHAELDDACRADIEAAIVRAWLAEKSNRG